MNLIIYSMKKTDDIVSSVFFHQTSKFYLKTAEVVVQYEIDTNMLLAIARVAIGLAHLISS